MGAGPAREPPRGHTWQVSTALGVSERLATPAGAAGRSHGAGLTEKQGTRSRGRRVRWSVGVGACPGPASGPLGGFGASRTLTGVRSSVHSTGSAALR